MLVLTTAAAKGGAGKTTTVVGLSCRFAARGLNVLVVDMDPQSTTSYYLGVKPVRTVAELLVPTEHEAPSFNDVVHQSVVPGVWLLPSERTSLDRVDRHIVAEGPTGYDRLMNVLSAGVGRFDLCLIDTPPQIVGLTEMALISADAVIATMLARPSYYPGVADMLAKVTQVRRRLNPDIRELGVVLCDMAEEENSVQAALLVEASSWPVLGCVPRSVLPEKSFRRRVPFMLTDPKKKVSRAYAEIGDRVLGQLGLQLGELVKLDPVPPSKRKPISEGANHV